MIIKQINTWHRHTISEFKANRSTTFPFPSSPHCAPKTTVTLLDCMLGGVLTQSPLTSECFEFVIEAIFQRNVDFAMKR